MLNFLLCKKAVAGLSLVFAITTLIMVTYYEKIGTAPAIICLGLCLGLYYQFQMLRYGGQRADPGLMRLMKNPVFLFIGLAAACAGEVAAIYSRHWVIAVIAFMAAVIFFWGLMMSTAGDCSGRVEKT